MLVWIRPFIFFLLSLFVRHDRIGTQTETNGARNRGGGHVTRARRAPLTPSASPLTLLWHLKPFPQPLNAPQGHRPLASSLASAESCSFHQVWLVSIHNYSVHCGWALFFLYTPPMISKKKIFWIHEDQPVERYRRNYKLSIDPPCNWIFKTQS